MRLSLSQRLLKREAVYSRHPHIRHGAINLIEARVVKEFVR